MTTECYICGKKIKPIYKQMYTCRCKGIFCSKHMHKHDCTVNYNHLFREDNKVNVKNIIAIQQENKITEI